MYELILVVNLIQLGLTVTFLTLCVHLFATWGVAFKEALKSVGGYRWWKAWKEHEIWSAEQWLVVGIVTGFMGNALDNIYWGFVWGFKYFDSPLSDSLMEAGPLSNVLFRQGFGIWAVYCHLVAAQKITSKKQEIPIKTYFLLGLGTISVLFLW